MLKDFKKIKLKKQKANYLKKRNRLKMQKIKLKNWKEKFSYFSNFLINFLKKDKYKKKIL